MAEEVRVIYFKSIDGRMYKTEAEAERADRNWRAENEVDLTAEIARLDKEATRMKLRVSKSRNEYPVLWVQHGKHGDDYYLLQHPDDRFEAGWDIFSTMMDYGCFMYSVKKKMISEELLRTENKMAATVFMQEEATGEYQRVSSERVTTYTNIKKDAESC